ncbi:MAG TPA: hypothetical protein DDY31_12435 [Lachnospiraceae bacterium]|nr:hypothetical protein [Lachnospiraceae bacterium]
MDKVTAVPLKEVAGVKFGMKRSEVRKVLGEANEFKKSKFSKTFTDDFGFCHVFYNSEDECEAIELFREAQVLIGGRLVFPTTLDEAKRILGELLVDDGSYISKKDSVGIYAPGGSMESILFGIDGYYE